jgi:hypothetical protein
MASTHTRSDCIASRDQGRRPRRSSRRIRRTFYTDAARHVDELELHVVPLLLGGGARLFEGLGPDLELEQIRVVEAPGVVHLKYRVVR